MARMRQRKINPGRAMRADASPADLARFFAKVEESDAGCWEWTAHCDENGYGQLKFNGKAVWAHRFAYAVFVRSIPAGREIDHKCSNTKCVNPKHLVCRSALANATSGGMKRHTPPRSGRPDPVLTP